MLARIVPVEHEDKSRPMPTQGTKVLLSDGVELPHVEKIVLEATPDSLWRAELTVATTFQPLNAEARVFVRDYNMLELEERWTLMGHHLWPAGKPAGGDAQQALRILHNYPEPGVWLLRELVGGRIEWRGENGLKALRELYPDA